MPKLSKLEFAELARSMPGASPEDIFTAAKAREDASVATEPRSATLQVAQNIAGVPGAALAGMLPGWVRKATDAVAAPALRMVPALGGAMLGGALGGPVGAAAGGALGAGLGETGAESLEAQTGARKNLNPGQIGFQAALGAIPTVGKVGGVVSGALNRGLQGAVLGGAGAAGTEYLETGELPSLQNVAMGAGVGGVLGGGMGALEGRAASQAAKQLAASASTTSHTPVSPATESAVASPSLQAYTPEDIAVKASELHNANGGSTFSLKTGQVSDAPMFSVSTFPGRELKVPSKDVSPETMLAFIQKNRDVLDQEGTNFGSWHNPEDGNTYLDVSTMVPSLDEALALGQKHNQLAVYDHQNFKTIDVPKSGTTASAPPVSQMAGDVPPEFHAVEPGTAPPSQGFQPPIKDDEPLVMPKGGQAAFMKEKAKLDEFRRGAADARGEQKTREGAGAFTAASIAAPAVAQAIPDDPDSEWDDYARAGLNVAGAAGLAHIGLSPRMATKLTAILKTGESEAKGLTFVRKYLKENISDPAKANTLFQQFAAKDVVPKGPLANIDLSARKPLINGVVKLKKVAFKDAASGKLKARTEATLTPEATNRLDTLFEHAKTLGADWTKDGAELEKLIPDGTERRMFTRAFAALSPTTPLELNFLQSAVAYPMLKAGASPEEVIAAVSKHPGLGVGNPNSKGPNLGRAAAGEELSGEKVSALDKGVFGKGSDEVPLDIHFLRAMGAVEEKRPPKLLYEAINRAITKHAQEKFGIGAFDYMAPIWGAMRSITTGDAGAGVAQLAKRVGLDQPSVFTGNTLARFGPEDFPGAPKGLNNPAAKPALDPQVMRQRMYPEKASKPAPDALAAARKAGQQKLFDKDTQGDIYKTPSDIERELQKLLAKAPSLTSAVRYLPMK